MPFQRAPTHVGFSDESHWNLERYRTLALVTTPLSDANAIDVEVRAILQKDGVGELKWKSVSSAKHRFAANHICDFACGSKWRGRMRVDVLIWDTHDSRHDVRRRDDSANLGRMYYHLIRNVIERRWPDARSWRMRVDERNDTDWGTLERCLRGQSRKQKTAHEPSFISMAAGPGRRPLHIEEGISKNNPLIQVADLFAGLAAFSWNKSEEHHAWRAVRVERDAGQQSLFPDLAAGDVSNSAWFKHEVLDHFLDIDLPNVVIRAHGGEGLRTFRPHNPINFWLYEPHSSDDKAPRRLIA